MVKVILYYNFSKIGNIEKFCADHRRKCEELNLMGRVYIAHEGINGTLAGRVDDIKQYKEYLRSLRGFGNTEFKEDSNDYIPFVKLIVKTRPEIVTLKTDISLEPQNESDGHISPRQWRKMLESNEDFVLLDVRNDYESEIGHFEGAVRPSVKNFYDSPQWLDEVDFDKDKKVLMYCTGGIRCEKFSVLMKKKGFKDVKQLHGGIINYAKKEGGQHFKGKCFVFDDRLVVPVEKNQKEPISKCEITGTPCDQYLNCANPDCNRLFICSKEGAKKMKGCCSEECLSAPRLRPFDEENIYEPTRKWYTYFDEKVS